jgi:hypothetical protein
MSLKYKVKKQNKLFDKLYKSLKLLENNIFVYVINDKITTVNANDKEIIQTV